MLLNRIYYRSKPYVPWHLRMFMRRVVAQANRRLHSHIWPINEAAGKRPANWPGWPNGKKFALVLTHDVESSYGLAKCRKLMHLEQSLGVRSSFNFVPEGDYNVPLELRQELHQNGFEVGVHDLRHDGKLFWRADSYSKKTQSINGYLNDWQAHGFRSGFMFHNREFLHQLDILYDASTFDTDPFEPQPEGTGTIFPFWVPRPGGGYVELPYTLPQDSTLFLVLKESSSEIWKRKLDWIVAHGGMALLDVHPDYLGFNGRENEDIEYPSALYADFIRYVQENYADQYWNPLPHELASWYKQSCQPGPAPKLADIAPSSQPRLLDGKRAAVVLFSYYKSDPRPRREAEALCQAGMKVDVICLRQDDQEPANEIVNGVNVSRVPLKRRRSGKLTYMMQYLWFWICSFTILSAWSAKRRYHLVHVHNMPDFLVFSALVPKLLGAKVILDLHDPMPELMVTIFGLKETSKSVRLLKFIEKASIRFANQVLTVNLACKKIFSGRSSAPEKIMVLMNVPDERIFKYRAGEDYADQPPEKPFVIMYHGSIVERNGLDLALEALNICRQAIPGAKLCIYGPTTPFLDEVLASARKHNLNGAICYLGPKPQEEIAREIQKCDVGVIPNRNNAFTEINMPTRIFEYLSLGKPVITPRSRGITDYFGATDLIYFELGDAGDLASKFEYVRAHPEEVKAIVKRGQAVYLEHCWSRSRENFLARVANLLNLRPTL